MSSLAFESIVRSMIDQGIPLEKAEREARRFLKLPEPEAVARDEKVLEDEEQLEIVKLARSLGFSARSTSSKKKARISIGFPDLWLTHDRHAFAFWWETKRQTTPRKDGAPRPDPRTPAQIVFGEDCHRNRVLYGFGDRFAFGDFLIAHGVAERHGPHLLLVPVFHMAGTLPLAPSRELPSAEAVGTFNALPFGPPPLP